MNELVVAPDIEAAITAYLVEILSGRDDPAVVSTEIPDPRPLRLVRLSRTGGPRRNRITDAPVLIFEFWDVDEIAACDLGRLVEAAVLATDGTFIGDPPVWIEDITVSGGLAFFPDPDTTLPRYQLTLQLNTNCEVI